MKMFLCRILVAIVLIFAFSAPGVAAETKSIAVVGAVVGKAHILRENDKIPLARGFKLTISDQIVTSKNAVVEMHFPDGSNVIVSENSSLNLQEYKSVLQGDKVTMKSIMNLIRGKARFFFKPRTGGHDAKVVTKTAVLGIRGTLFLLDDQEENSTKVVVLSGKIQVARSAEPEKPVTVLPNQIVSVSSNQTLGTPQTLSTKDVETFKSEFQLPSDVMPDGYVPDAIEFPVPEPVLDDSNETGKNDLRDSNESPSSPSIRVIQLKANRCDTMSLNEFKEAAQSLDLETPSLARTLFKCSQARSQVLFWLYFYYVSRAELRQAAEIHLQLPASSDNTSERGQAIERALRKDFQKLLASIATKGSPESKDSEALFVLARSLSTSGKYAAARESYSLVQNLNIPQDLKNEAKIESTYTLLMERKFEDAKQAFDNLLDERLSKDAILGARRGYEIASAETLSSWRDANQPERIDVSARTTNYGEKWNNQKFEIFSATRYFDAKVGLWQGEFPDELKNNVKTQFYSLSLGRSFRFPYRLGLKWELGYAGGETHHVLGSVVADISYTNGWRPYIQLQRRVLAKYEKVSAIGAQWLSNSLHLGVTYSDIFQYDLEMRIVDQYTVFLQSLHSHLDIISGMPESEFVRLAAYVNHETHPFTTFGYFSPQSKVQGLAGLETRIGVTQKIDLELDALFGVRQTGNPKYNESDSLVQDPINDPFRNEYTEKTATVIRGKVGFHYSWFKGFQASIWGQMDRNDSLEQEKISATTVAVGALQYVF